MAPLYFILIVQSVRNKKIHDVLSLIHNSRAISYQLLHDHPKVSLKFTIHFINSLNLLEIAHINTQQNIVLDL